MATLLGFIDTSSRPSGFLLPIFISNKNANTHLVQRISLSGNIKSFESIGLDQPIMTKVDINVKKEINDSAIWIFRDHIKITTIGSANDIAVLAKPLLRSDFTDRFPLIAAELAIFCGFDNQYHTLFRSAFSYLQNTTSIGAPIWRDTIILLPRIREDIINILPSDILSRIEMSSIFAISNKSSTDIYVPETISPLIKRLPRFTETAKIFGITEFKIHNYKNRFAGESVKTEINEQQTPFFDK